jgi:hypothetical protein
MARKHNFLLGNGEKLTAPVLVPSGGGEKKPPYTLTEAQERFKERVRLVSERVDALPLTACPGGEAVLSLTMHPRYISKSDFPNILLNSLGLRSVGSRPTKVKPEKWGIQRHPSEALTEEIFVAGPRERIYRLEGFINSLVAGASGVEDLLHIEDITVPSATGKLKLLSVTPNDEREWLEVVLHNQAQVEVLEAFTAHARLLGADVDVSRSRNVRGLTFVPVAATRSVAEPLAQFAFLRVARAMPTLRPFRPTLLRASAGPRAILPTDGPVTTNQRALIFDGGIPVTARTLLKPWVNLIEPKDVGSSLVELEQHGLAVTSAFLFGPIDDYQNLQRPICGVDHVRVLDEALLTSTDPYYFDVLERILAFLDTEGKNYSLINISVGPNLPTADDEVTLWTAELDARLASGDWVVTVAAGNEGERDPIAGLNRIQPPADGVNVLAVGASDSFNSLWGRAPYSCTGPGRNPGLVKPDGLAFGGCDNEPFPVLSQSIQVENTQGTSFAAPFALRSAAAIKAQLGDALKSLAIRALLVHRADVPNGLATSEAGWGRFESDPEKLITCEDHEALVIYQGDLPIGEHLRAPVPLPLEPLEGMVEVAATLLISTEVDPGYPSAYTRSGLTVSFRPHADKFINYDDGTVSRHPKTRSFFSATNMYGASEFTLREDGQKWEPCLKGQTSMRFSSLKLPCFDIYNHRREEGAVSVSANSNASYALVVTVRARRVRDLYDRVIRAYANVLIPLRPKVRIEIK